MGVKDPALRRRLETAMPGADPALAGGVGGDRQAVSPVNAAAREASGRRGTAFEASAPVLLVCRDAGGGLGGLDALLAALDLPAYAVCLPEGDLAEAPADVAELASLAVKMVRAAVPAGARLLLAGEHGGHTTLRCRGCVLHIKSVTSRLHASLPPPPSVPSIVTSNRPS